MLEIRWDDWWLVAAAVLSKSNDNGWEADLTTRLRSSVETISTAAIVSILKMKKRISYELAKALIAVELKRSPIERQSIVNALLTPEDAGPIASILWAISRATVDDSGVQKVALEGELVDRLSETHIFKEQAFSHDEAVLILLAVDRYLIETGALSRLPDAVQTSCFDSLLCFRSKGRQAERVLGRISASHAKVAARLLRNGSADEKKAVIDVLLDKVALVTLEIQEPLRKISQSGEHNIRAKAAWLLLRSKDGSALQSAVAFVKPSGHARRSAEELQLYHGEIIKYVTSLTAQELRALMPLNSAREIVLSAMVCNHPELLQEEDVLPWALRTLGDLTWNDASKIRHQMQKYVPTLAPRLSLILGCGTSKERYQARELLTGMGQSRQKHG